MDFSRLECRDLLANVNKTNVDPDVLAKLMTGANVTSTYTVFPGDAGRPPTESIDGIPVFTPVVYSAEEFARLNATRAAAGEPPVTHGDIAEVNRIKEAAHNAEWRARLAYKANLNPNDAVNAAFDAPERDRGFDPNLEVVKVGGQNKAGDYCVALDALGASVYRCSNGHGYTQSRSLRTCPSCFMAGSANIEADTDPGSIAGADSRF